jgi:hypothetical protein
VIPVQCGGHFNLQVCGVLTLPIVVQSREAIVACLLIALPTPDISARGGGNCVLNYYTLRMWQT